MVHKKYIKRDGKTFGPYLYQNYREKGVTKTRYLGLAKERKNLRVNLLLVLGIILLFFLLIGSIGLFVISDKEELKGELAEFLFLENKLFIFSTSVLFSVDLKTKERKKILLPSKSPIIRAPYKLGNKIRFTCDDIVFTISKANEIEILNYNPKKFGSNIFPKFFEYQKKDYLLLYDNSMNKNQIFQIQENDLKEVYFPEELQNNRIITISENNDDLWLCSSNGIVILNKKNNQFVLKDVIFKN